MKLVPGTRRGALWRFLLAAVVVVLFTATATAVAGLLQFKQFASELSLTKPLPDANIMVANPGNPQTLLLIGSDHRAGTPWSDSNTDTMMLVRLDPSSSTINLLSIPRDLKVMLPQGPVVAPAKLNTAYSLGGPNLLVQTLQQQVFPGININHIVDVNFGSFQAMVNAIGCIYAQVDHRYYNDSAVTDYSSIDIQPGYQRLCGSDALAFVRFRHTDTDIVRNARQQDFLRWAKSQFTTASLVAQRNKLITVFGQHTETDADLHSIDGLINLFNLVAFSAGNTVKQVPFPAILGPCDPAGNPQNPCYVLADPGAEQRAYQQFLTPTIQAPAQPAPSSPPRPAQPAAPPPPVPVTADLSDAQAQAHEMGNAGMPVYVPGRIANGYQYCAPSVCPEGPVPNSYPRVYQISDQDGRQHAAYVITAEGNSLEGQYYEVQGTTWQDPPILNGPHKTQSVAGKQLLEYFSSDKLTLVAWHGPGGVYWIANTLTNDLSNAQMVALAASLTPA